MNKKTSELELIEDNDVVVQHDIVPVNESQQLIQYAISQNASIEQMKELMLMKRDAERYEAEKAFNLAMSQFSVDAPKITKDKLVSYGNTSYNHASLGNVVSTIVSALSKHGLSHRWLISQEDRMIKVTCKLTHSLGFGIETSMTAPADDSGKKNIIQSQASTITYLQRYTLLSITGCATEEDDDGIAAGDRLTILDNQVQYIENLIESKGNVNMEKFLTHFSIMDIPDMQQRDYKEAVSSLGGNPHA